MKRCWLARYWALAVKNGEHRRLGSLFLGFLGAPPLASSGAPLAGLPGGPSPGFLHSCLLSLLCRGGFWAARG